MTLTILQEKSGTLQVLKFGTNIKIRPTSEHMASMASFSNVYPRPVDALCLITKHTNSTHLTSSILHTRER